MRKYLLFFLTLFLLTLPALVLAATTFVVTSDTVIGPAPWSTMQTRVILLTATDDTADSDPSLALSDDTSGLSGSLDGWWLYQLYIDGNHAGTEPTEDSDLTVTCYDYDWLATGGTDKVDNTQTNRIDPTSVPFTDTVTFTITNNSVDGAITYIYLILYAEKVR